MRISFSQVEIILDAKRGLGLKNTILLLTRKIIFDTLLEVLTPSQVSCCRKVSPPIGTSGKRLSCCQIITPLPNGLLAIDLLFRTGDHFALYESRFWAKWNAGNWNHRCVLPTLRLFVFWNFKTRMHNIRMFLNFFVKHTYSKRCLISQKRIKKLIYRYIYNKRAAQQILLWTHWILI